MCSSRTQVMNLLLVIILAYYSLELVCVDGTDIEIGNAIDLFRNYGLLMRIFPVDANHNEFLQTEFSQNVFDRSMSKR